MYMITITAMEGVAITIDPDCCSERVIFVAPVDGEANSWHCVVEDQCPHITDAYMAGDYSLPECNNVVSNISGLLWHPRHTKTSIGHHTPIDVYEGLEVGVSCCGNGARIVEHHTANKWWCFRHNQCAHVTDRFRMAYPGSPAGANNCLAILPTFEVIMVV